MFKKTTLASTLLLTASSSLALPIDWHGVFGVDTTLIENYRRIEGTNSNAPVKANSKAVPSAVTNPGSQEVDLSSSGKDSASFQSYVFRLSPHIIINDSTSFKAELTSGYGRGGNMGDSSQKSQRGLAAGTLYSYNTTSENNLNINKLYVELFADTATWVIGRHDFEFGMGAVYDAGNDVWDRHTFVRDGITAKLKIGNFKVEPFYAKVSSDGSLTKSHRVREFGASLVYDNIDNDFMFGLLYNKKTNSPNADSNTTSGTNDVVDTNADGTPSSLGSTDVTVTDIYIKKGFKDFVMELEVPLTSGEIGNFFENNQNAKYKAKAFLFASNYSVNETWSFGVDAGHVSGQDSSDSFTAMYLNPNFQVANLLFRYNLHAVTDPNQNIYDSYITNTMYAKLHGKFQTEKWEWDAALIWAQALETASAGQAFFNHEQNYSISAANSVADQSSDLGIEVDVSFKYKWNSAVEIGGNAGYLFAGDYWAYTNTGTPNTAKDSYVLQLNTAVKF